ncbi:hypothetical protein RRG08_005929 [Elysia crispata]|uniref:Uncharacterized protein n=1 Tax=Elysia crispata TaxID=231223 RepID=A0AAE0Z9L7_9GAST|nr:hypothetical protein RRG08_005929 [Elysia crispata]
MCGRPLACFPHTDRECLTTSAQGYRDWTEYTSLPAGKGRPSTTPSRVSPKRSPSPYSGATFRDIFPDHYEMARCPVGCKRWLPASHSLDLWKFLASSIHHCGLPLPGTADTGSMAASLTVLRIWSEDFPPSAASWGTGLWGLGRGFPLGESVNIHPTLLYPLNPQQSVNIHLTLLYLINPQESVNIHPTLLYPLNPPCPRHQHHELVFTSTSTSRENTGVPTTHRGKKNTTWCGTKGHAESQQTGPGGKYRGRTECGFTELQSSEKSRTYHTHPPTDTHACVQTFGSGDKTVRKGHPGTKRFLPKLQREEEKGGDLLVM